MLWFTWFSYFWLVLVFSDINVKNDLIFIQASVLNTRKFLQNWEANDIAINFCMKERLLEIVYISIIYTFFHEHSTVWINFLFAFLFFRYVNNFFLFIRISFLHRWVLHRLKKLNWDERQNEIIFLKLEFYDNRFYFEWIVFVLLFLGYV